MCAEFENIELQSVCLAGLLNAAGLGKISRGIYRCFHRRNVKFAVRMDGTLSVPLVYQNQKIKNE